MHDLLVIMAASQVRGTMRLYVNQLEDAGIEIHVEGMPELKDGGLKTKIATLERLGERFSHYDRLIMSDAFDVTFYGTKEDVIRKIPERGLLWAAEKNCWPEPLLATTIPGRSPWRFANGGLVCGTPTAFREWAQAAANHPRYREDISDQLFLNELLALRSMLAKVDTETELFFCLYNGYDELMFEAGIPLNRMMRTHPNFIHANGNWSPGEMFALYVQSIRKEVSDGDFVRQAEESGREESRSF